MRRRVWRATPVATWPPSLRELRHLPEHQRSPVDKLRPAKLKCGGRCGGRGQKDRAGPAEAPARAGRGRAAAGERAPVKPHGPWFRRIGRRRRMVDVPREPAAHGVRVRQRHRCRQGGPVAHHPPHPPARRPGAVRSGRGRGIRLCRPGERPAGVRRQRRGAPQDRHPYRGDRSDVPVGAGRRRARHSQLHGHGHDACAVRGAHLLRHLQRQVLLPRPGVVDRALGHGLPPRRRRSQPAGDEHGGCGAERRGSRAVVLAGALGGRREHLRRLWRGREPADLQLRVLPRHRNRPRPLDLLHQQVGR